jgi:hypothetical protein
LPDCLGGKSPVAASLIGSRRNPVAVPLRADGAIVAFMPLKAEAGALVTRQGRPCNKRKQWVSRTQAN